MIELSKGGAYLVDGVDVIEESAAQQGALAARLGTDAPSKEEAAKNTIAYSILESHNTSGNMDKLKVKFDKMTSHDITWLKYGEGYLIFYDWHNGITKVMENEGSTERWKRRTQERKR